MRILPPSKQPAEGFTLIELMLVLLIIGVLLNISVPFFRDELDKARLSEIVLKIDANRSALATAYQTGNRDMFTTIKAQSLASPDLPQPLASMGMVGGFIYPNLVFVLGKDDKQFGNLPAGTSRLYIAVIPRGAAGRPAYNNLMSLLPENITEPNATHGRILLAEDTSPH